MNAISLTATGTDSLAVTRLRLTRFRNYASLALDLEPITVVATGPNGAGKTNLLEAISFLAPGRGLRGARLGDDPPEQCEASKTRAAEAELSCPPSCQNLEPSL